MKKKDIRISDAIPQVPASFDAAVERALKTVAKTSRKTTVRVIEGDSENGAGTRKPLNRIQKLGLVSAAAVLVLCTLGVVALLITRGLRPRDNSADRPLPQTGESTPTSGPDRQGEEPNTLLPDADDGVFNAAYAQVLYEQSEFDRTYEERRTKMQTMSEEDAQDYEQIMDAEENFLHQRLVRLQRICEVTASVEQEVDRMRLSEVAYLDGRLYFAFTASKVWAFDAEPKIKVNGCSFSVIDESGFFALNETETVQYAFYSIEPGTLSGTVLITVRNNDHDFCFKYNIDEGTVAQPQDDAERLAWIEGSAPEEPHTDESPQNDVSYYFLVNSMPVYPYEGFLWESRAELEADGLGVRLEDEKVRSQIPVTEYSASMPFVVLTADGWKLDQIMVYDAAYERIATVGRSEIPWVDRYGYVATDLLNTLSPGVYYVSAIVAYRTENYSTGNEIAICLHIVGENMPEAQLPAMFVSGGWPVEPYVLRSDRVDPKRLNSISAMPIVAYSDDLRIESRTGIKRLDVYDTEGEPVILDQPDASCLKTLAPGYYRLVVCVTGTDKTDYACICTLKVNSTPSLFLVNEKPVIPYENFLWEDKDGLAADGISIFYMLKDEKVRGEIPYTMFLPNTSLEMMPGSGWELDRVVLYAIDGGQIEQLARIERGELIETENGYAASKELRTLTPGIYYLSAVVSHREGKNSKGYECAIELQIDGESAQPTLAPWEKPNTTLVPMICYHGEQYCMHSEIRPDVPDETASLETVTSVVPLSVIPTEDKQANFGSVGMEFYVTAGGLVVRYNDEWRLLLVIEWGSEG